MKKLKDLIKSLKEFHVEGTMYELEKLELYKEALFAYSKYKIGDVVQLARTPVITERVSWGWLSYKDILIKGAFGIVQSLDYYIRDSMGTFRYEILLGNNIFNFNEEDITNVDKDKGK